MAAPIQIDLQGINCSFDIGGSLEADKAKAKYQNYLNHHRFEDLSDCLFHLHLCLFINDEPQQQSLKRNICLACNAIALSTINQSLNNYQRIFISSSLLSKIALSGQAKTLQNIAALWANTQSIWVRKVLIEGLDEARARETGVVFFRRRASDSYNVCTMHKLS